MSISQLKMLPQAGVIAVAGCAIMLSQAAYAEPTGYNQLSFSAEASQEVENDEVTATLSKKAQSSNPKRLAVELNKAINNAMKTAKNYPSVTVTTGSQNTYPKYNKSGKIVGWTGSVSVDLKSNDFEATSELIANLQESLVMKNLRFGVSEKKQETVENELMTKASKAFQQQASSMVSAWNASGYQLIKVSVNTNGNYGYNPPMPIMRSAAMDKSSLVPVQNLQSGNSKVTVTANGTIELIPKK